MYCGNCGAVLSKGEVFCGNCGEQVENRSNGSPARGALSLKPLIIIGGGVIGVIAVAFIAYTVFMNTGNRYILTTLNKSQKAYTNEINKLISDNPVFKSAGNSLSGSWIQEIDAYGAGTVALVNDKRGKTLMLEAASGIVNLRAAAYVTDSRMIAGMDGVFYVEANPKALGTDMMTLVENMTGGLGFLLGDISDVISGMEESAALLDSFDFSYSSLIGGNIVTKSHDYKEFYDLLSKQAGSLLKHARYDKLKDQMEIGNKTVNTDLLQLTIGPDELEAWYAEDLLPALRGSAVLRDYYESLVALADPYGAAADYNAMLDELDYSFYEFLDEMAANNGEIVFGAYVYKGVAVGLEMYLLSDYYDDRGDAPRVIISAAGGKNRLDDIRLTVYGENGREEMSVRIAGDHFSKTLLTTTITTEEYGYTEEAYIEWDLTNTRNNLRIEYDGETEFITLAVTGDEVIFEAEGVSWSLARYNERVTLPADTLKLSEVSLLDLLKEIEAVSDMLDFLSNII
jgi:hypothetical protein